MSKKYLTERFPFLLPLRKKQRIACFYAGMRWDKHTYAKEKEKDLLPYVLYETSCELYNPNTGFDMKYQENKVFNLKLAANKMNHLLIKPREMFSLFQAIRHADRPVSYKEGLVVEYGVLKTSYGGGLCQLSNSLFLLFLHSPLTIFERHGHSKKDFPEAKGDQLLGMDATIAEGWLDLKVQNQTEATFQIEIDFTSDRMILRLRCNQDLPNRYEIENGPVIYKQVGSSIFEEVDVIQVIQTKDKKEIARKVLYRNRCEIGYKLDSSIEVLKEVTR